MTLSVSLSVTAVALGAAVGVGLGAIYLGLLWLAVRSLPDAGRGLRRFAWLAVARLALLLGALAVAAALGLPAEGIAAALAGFVALRVAATRRLGRDRLEDATWK